MALYLGSNNKKVKVFLNGDLIRFNIFSTNLILNGIKLISSDNYILKDINNVYLTAKEDK